MATLLDLSDFLPGNWHLVRTVKGFPHQDVITMEGTAVFLSRGKNLTYNEKGSYFYQEQYLCFQQTYDYQWEKERGYKVYFQDKRLFYSLALHDKEQHIKHLCGRDTYQGLFIWYAKDVWKQHWYVKGPAKDFRIETRYERVYPNFG